MASVQAKDGDEGFESLIRRYKRLVDKSGLPKRLREIEYHVPSSKLKQKRAASAKKRLQKKLARERAMREALQGPASKRTTRTKGRGRGVKGKGTKGKGGSK